jgi:hypothetical protein
MTDPSNLDWIFGRFLAAKTLGGRRRRRALRWALRRMVGRTAKEQGRATTPHDAAYHQGAHSVYSANLCTLDGSEAPSVDPPADTSLLHEWRRGCEDAASHSQEMYEQIIGRPLPS